MREWRYRAFASAALTLALAGCGGTSDSPMGPSVTLSTPTISFPTPGSLLTENQPTFIVDNVSATDGATPTYTFQVATDSAFANIVAQADGVAQGSDGETSWKVPTPLENRPHFWRTRARVDTTDGPFSAVADFEVAAVFK